MSASSRDVDAYLAALPSDARATLEVLRKTIKAVVPDAIEEISYQMPAYRHKGRPLVYFAAFKDHCSFFPASTSVIQAHKKELQGYELSKGTIRFPIGKPLPAALVKKLVKARIAENAARNQRRKRA